MSDPTQDRITIISPDGEEKNMANFPHIVEGYLRNGWSIKGEKAAKAEPAEEKPKRAYRKKATTE